MVYEQFDKIPYGYHTGQSCLSNFKVTITTHWI